MKNGIQKGFIEPAMRKSGCYVFTLLRMCELLENRTMSESDIVGAYNILVANGYIETDCFVVNPIAVLNSNQRQVRYTNVQIVKRHPGIICPAYYKHPKFGGHFVLTNGEEKIIFDSMDQVEGNPEWQIESYRKIL